jgi:dephospho-CoA kinase
MHVIALTGGIGAGKSTAAEVFRSRGAAVLSLDDIGRRQLEPGTPVFQQVVAAFGRGIVDAEGRIDARALARTAFRSRESVEILNKIMHPAILREVESRLRDLELHPDPPTVVVIEVPLLVESPALAALAGRVLAISAPEEVRISRATAAGLDEDDARARLLCQASDADRAAIADDVIANDGSPEEFRAALERYWDEVVAHAP